MESVLIDQDVNPKKSVVVNKSGSYEGGFMTRTQSSFPSYASASQLFLSVNAGSGGNTASFGLFGSRPPPSRHSSLPSFPATPSVISPSPPFPPLIPQPPLLPLPFSKSATLPSPTPTKRIATVTTARSRDNRKKTKPAGNTRKEARSSSTASVRSDPVKGESVSVVPQKPAQKPSDPPAAVECEDKVEEGEKEREEGFAMESVYSLSPPPSSLPLPTFFLKRRKAAATAASCIAEAMGCGDAGGGGGGVNPGATDDLLRLLRL